MKRLLIYAIILALVWALPTERADVAKLRPVEVIAIYKTGDVVILTTDTDDRGIGASAMEALENMRSTSPAIIYLDTAEYLLVEDKAKKEIEQLRKELKSSVRLCNVTGTVDLKAAANYLPVHGQLPELRNWNTDEMLPVLYTENERLKISENSEKTLDKGR